MLSGLMSRCVSPHLCIAATPEQTCIRNTSSRCCECLISTSINSSLVYAKHASTPLHSCLMVATENHRGGFNCALFHTSRSLKQHTDSFFSYQGFTSTCASHAVQKKSRSQICNCTLHLQDLNHANSSFSCRILVENPSKNLESSSRRDTQATPCPVP